MAIDDASREKRSRVLGLLERSFLLPTTRGLPSRPYYLHVLQAPNLINDYGYQLLPAVAYYAAAQSSNADMQGALDDITTAIRAASALVDTLGGPLLSTPAIVVLRCVGRRFFSGDAHSGAQSARCGAARVRAAHHARLPQPAQEELVR